MINTFEQALERIKQLEDGIREHMQAIGNNRCWLNNLKLYSLLNEPLEINSKSIRDISDLEFIHNCIKYKEEENR